MEYNARERAAFWPSWNTSPVPEGPICPSGALYKGKIPDFGPTGTRRVFQKGQKEKTYVTYKSKYIKYIFDIYSKYMFDTIFNLALLKHRTPVGFFLLYALCMF